MHSQEQNGLKDIKMKIIKYDKSPMGKKTIVQITRNEAMLLIAELSNQLCKSKHPSFATEVLTESGEFVDIQIDFNKE